MLPDPVEMLLYVGGGRVLPARSVESFPILAFPAAAGALFT
jgi:hypothetical protein